jgi:hypothetical protein
VQAIGDFASREAAEEVYGRITGQPFAASYQAAPRLRAMHAGPDLLAALEELLAEISDLATASIICDEILHNSFGKAARAAVRKARAA